MEIYPLPGFIVTKPYLSPNQTFQSVKEESGFCQKSEVVAIGGSYTDDHGNLRECPVKVGDVILHKWSTDDFDIEFTKYRAVPFYTVIAKLEETKDVDGK